MNPDIKGDETRPDMDGCVNVAERWQVQTIMQTVPKPREKLSKSSSPHTPVLSWPEEARRRPLTINLAAFISQILDVTVSPTSPPSQLHLHGPLLRASPSYYRQTNIAASLTLVVLTMPPATSSAAELQIETIKTGDGTRAAKNGDRLFMHYKGTLADGSVFDSSYTRDEPFALVLGQGMVIKGWDEGLVGMCKGEVRKLVIPSDKAYGDRGFPPVIPGKATLTFEVELVDFGAGDEEREL